MRLNRILALIPLAAITVVLASPPAPAGTGGQKANAVPPTRLLLARFWAETNAQPYLGAWDPALLPEAALEAISERCCQSVRELEGCLNRVLAYIPLVGGQATPEAVEKALSPFAASGAGAAAAAPDADAIVAAVGRRTGVSPADIRGRSRSRDVT